MYTYDKSNTINEYSLIFVNTYLYLLIRINV